MKSSKIYLNLFKFTIIYSLICFLITKNQELSYILLIFGISIFLFYEPFVLFFSKPYNVFVELEPSKVNLFKNYLNDNIKDIIWIDEKTILFNAKSILMFKGSSILLIDFKNDLNEITNNELNKYFKSNKNNVLLNGIYSEDNDYNTLKILFNSRLELINKGCWVFSKVNKKSKIINFYYRIGIKEIDSDDEFIYFYGEYNGNKIF